MKEFILRIANGRIRLCDGDSFPCDKALLRFENGTSGSLVLGDEQLPVPAEGVILSADTMQEGTFTLSFFLHGERLDGPQITVGAGYLFFPPPTHAQLCAAEERIDRLEAIFAPLEERLSAVEAHILNTNIF